MDSGQADADDGQALPAPAASEAGMSPEQLQEAREYGRLRLACGLLDRAVDVVFLTAFALWMAIPLHEATLQAGLPGGRLVRLVSMYLVMGGLHLVVSLPLAYYTGFRLEHRFGLSRLTFPRWLARFVKRSALAGGLGLVLVVGLYTIIWTVGHWWWLVASGAFFLVSVVLGQLAPVLILPLFYKLEKLDAPELAERLQRLAAGTGLRVGGVYRMGLSVETAKANAMLAGLGATRRVILGDTLLERFSPEEIEVVFAHEVGHHVHRHIPKMLLSGLVSSLAGFWLVGHAVLFWVAWQGGPGDFAQLPAWSLPALMLLLTVFFQLLEPLQNAISRHYERQSDRYALERTSQPEAYRSAFEKLARINKSDPHPHWLEVVLFHSHPPIAERLRMARRAEA